MATTLHLKGPTVVFIDWANVHGWQKTLKCEIDLDAVREVLKNYSEIEELRLYHGTDVHPSSVRFIERMRRHGYVVITKPVKYIEVRTDEGVQTHLRKCDFDIEICIDLFRALAQEKNGFIFFSGDGDFAPMYRELLRLHKQVIVVYAPKHIGKEVWEIPKGIFKIEVRKLLPQNCFREKSSPGPCDPGA
ncbi:MAG: hypothetical protein COV10_00985 [Candidatus Vogelbacteria bacterium CG10_big_fil_rev_8_21_14_0_10_51_16]|uniref:NYN domain-containing protein n=1 Tax=Candidatus Vogelbacteria bacterium CG10_big_fil_rev_8_21_14_0_10_51_16 TaxID=1975045 RepID=A0A2H0RH22_9BACT|nr:MAG: hypothetical protein COV10_00985 [Candidatus Vogelbacteria bacterium CG10_big_fil_rev_8_21_14_0_10_51_16]